MNFKNKSFLVTGGTGSFGQAIVKELSKKYKPKKIVIFSRDELKQYIMEKEYLNNKSIRFFLGDIRDLDRLSFALKDIDIVIHAAALKQVATGEYNPFEAVKTNIIGTQNIIDSSMQNNVEKVIALSTDKASSPINLYGATKLTSDKLFISANNYKGKKNVKFSIVRYGNVMGSRGSVIPLFLEQKKKNLITITDKRMTRFNITLNSAVDFVMNSLSLMKGGEIFVPKLSSYKILDLKNAISAKSKIKLVGSRTGEKLHEELISIHEIENTLEYKNYFTIIPNSPYLNWDRKNFIKKEIRNGAKMYSSKNPYNSLNNKYFLNKNELSQLIKKNFHNE